MSSRSTGHITMTPKGLELLWRVHVYGYGDLVIRATSDSKTGRIQYNTLGISKAYNPAHQ